MARTGDGLDALVQVPFAGGGGEQQARDHERLDDATHRAIPQIPAPPGGDAGRTEIVPAPSGRIRPDGRDESIDSPGTLAALMIEIGTSGWPWRASGIAIGTALAAEADGAHVVWFADRIPLTVDPDELGRRPPDRCSRSCPTRPTSPIRW